MGLGRDSRDVRWQHIGLAVPRICMAVTSALLVGFSHAQLIFQVDNFAVPDFAAMIYDATSPDDPLPRGAGIVFSTSGSTVVVVTAAHNLYNRNTGMPRFDSVAASFFQEDRRYDASILDRGYLPGLDLAAVVVSNQDLAERVRSLVLERGTAFGSSSYRVPTFEIEIQQQTAIEQSEIRVIEYIYSVGFPDGIPWGERTDLLVTAKRKFTGDRLGDSWRLTLSRYAFGYSGGPVFMFNGGILGMALSTGNVESVVLAMDRIVEALADRGIQSHFDLTPYVDLSTRWSSNEQTNLILETAASVERAVGDIANVREFVILLRRDQVALRDRVASLEAHVVGLATALEDRDTASALPRTSMRATDASTTVDDHQVKAQSACEESVWMALGFVSTEGVLITIGWWMLDHSYQTVLNDEHGYPIGVPQTELYVFAETEGGTEVISGGDLYGVLDGRDLPMLRQVLQPDGERTLFIDIACSG